MTTGDGKSRKPTGGRGRTLDQCFPACDHSGPFRGMLAFSVSPKDGLRDTGQRAFSKHVLKYKRPDPARCGEERGGRVKAPPFLPGCYSSGLHPARGLSRCGSRPPPGAPRALRSVAPTYLPQLTPGGRKQKAMTAPAISNADIKLFIHPLTSPCNLPPLPFSHPTASS